jgi:hypothetical protein
MSSPTPPSGKALESCGLDADVRSLDEGDMTRIGAGGQMLSLSLQHR